MQKNVIVYCAGAAVSVPNHMWMCGRAVNKYRKDGEWRFKTQMDSSPEPDPWEVPEHYLLRVVDEVIHGANSQDSRLIPDESSYQDYSGFKVPVFVVELSIGIVIGAILGALTAGVYMTKKGRASQGSQESA